jgi:CheY-like chemotaxis protein
MDINLPDISGIDALQVLRADPTTARIPIVAISANAMPRDIEKGLEGRLLPLPHQAHPGATSSWRR